MFASAGGDFGGRTGFVNGGVFFVGEQLEIFLVEKDFIAFGSGRRRLDWLADEFVFVGFHKRGNDVANIH
jgi:hypothetical protein